MALDTFRSWVAPLAAVAIVAGCKSTAASRVGTDATGDGGTTSSSDVPSAGDTSSDSGGETSSQSTKSSSTSAGGAKAGGGSNAGGSNAGGSNAGGSNAGGTSQSGGSGAIGSTLGGSTASSTTQPVIMLTAQSVTAAVVGIHGDELAVTVKGTQNKVGDLLALEVTLLDASSQPITFFDTNQDGVLDVGAGSLVLDAVPTTTTINGSGTIARAGRLAALTTISVKLISITGTKSDAVTATVTPQAVVADGESCDPKGIANRCSDGTGCTGTTPKCSSTVVPTIDKSAYLSTSTGGTVVMAGTDMASALASVYVEFFDSADAPKGYDINGSGTLDPSFMSSNGITNTSGSFVWRISPTSDFVAAIPRLKLTPTDDASKAGTQITVNRAAIPIRSAGAACDTRGFDACPADSLCWPGAVAATGTCQTLSSKQTSQCSSATTLTIGSGSVRTAGRFSAVSLWSPPVACSTPNSLTAPDAVVHLKTTATIPNLVISTKTPETNVATVVYLLDSCNAVPTVARCSDRPLVAPSADAELQITNVVAGDYYVVIENLDFRPGSYGLVVTAQ